MDSRPRRGLTAAPQVAALMVFVVALWAQVGGAHVSRSLEDGLLLVLGKALARGEGLTFVNLPGAPSAVGIPPLYPVLLSIVGRVWPTFPDNVVLIQILDSGLLAIGAWIVVTHARGLRLSSLVTTVVLVAGFLSTSLLSLSASAFSEPLLLVLAAGTVLLADRRQRGYASAIGAGFVSGLAILTHSLGPAVVIAVVVGFLVRGRSRHAGAALAAALAVSLPWFLWSAFNQSVANALVDAALERVRTAGANESGMGFLGLGALIRQLVPANPSWFWLPAGVVSVALAGFGVVAVWKDSPTLPIVVVAAILWTAMAETANVRWIWVLFPWFLLLVTVGLFQLWQRGRATRPVVVAIGGLLALGYLPRTARDVAERRTAEDVHLDADITRLLQTIAQEIPENAVIASDDDAMIYLYTARLAVPPAPNEESDKSGDAALQYYCRNGVTHIARVEVPDQIGPRAETLGAPQVAVEPVFELTDGPGLYKIKCPS